MDANSILSHIESLALTAVEYRAARRLLDRVSDQWTCYLSRTDACTVCGVGTWAAARRVLNKLQEAGAILLHTNNRAYVIFCDRAETDHQRADPARDEPNGLTEPRQNGSPARQNGANRAETDLQRADPARLPRDWDQGSGMGREIDPLPSLPVLEGGAGGNPTTAPKRRDSAQNRRGATIPAADQARSVRLLTDPDVGLGEHNALRVAEAYPFALVRAQVFRFVRDHADGKAKSAGCIPQRLAQPQRFPASITESDRASPLWERHHTAEETAAMEAEEREAKYRIE